MNKIQRDNLRPTPWHASIHQKAVIGTHCRNYITIHINLFYIQ